MVVFRGAQPEEAGDSGGGGGDHVSLSPAQLRALYTKVHRALGWSCTPPSKLASAPDQPGDGNLRGRRALPTTSGQHHDT